MRKYLKVISTVILGAGILVAPSIVNAQEVNLGAEAGVAVPLTDPQAQRFSPGGAGALKLDVGLGSFFSVGPVVQVIQLPSKLLRVEDGNAWSYGGYLKFKRPHNDLNPDTGLSAAAPWVDVQMKAVHTDPLDRFGTSVGAGVAIPADHDRAVWVGPFVRYDIVHQQDGKPDTNTNSAKTLIFGLSLDLGPSHKVREELPPVRPVPPPPPPVIRITPTPVEEPVPVLRETAAHLKCVVGFDFDSFVLDNEALTELGKVTKILVPAKNVGHIVVAGHASSEGQVKYNDELSKHRAEAVSKFLVANGLSEDKLSVVWFGSRQPVADNKTEAGRSLNRRVEFEVDFTVVEEVKK